jgi:hypothetical protein
VIKCKQCQTLASERDELVKQNAALYEREDELLLVLEQLRSNASWCAGRAGRALAKYKAVEPDKEGAKQCAKHQE